MSSSSRTAARLRVAALLVVAGCLGGCLEHGARHRFTPPDYGPIGLPLPPDPEPGAVWPGEAPSGSFLFFDNKARGIGDLVTVVVDEDFLAESAASTALTRDSNITAAVSSDVGFAAFMADRARALLELFGTDVTAPDDENGVDIDLLSGKTASDFDGDGSTERSGKLRAVVTCRVVNVLPGGLFHIRGRRSVLVNREEQFLTVEGLVRKSDITINNTVPSIALAEAKLGFDGFGVVTSKQRPGWLSRLLEWIFPL